MHDVNGIARYTGTTFLLLAASIPVSSLMGCRYGKLAARRTSAGMASILLIQQVLVGIALRRSAETEGPERHRLTLVDLMTLSRGWAAALLAGLLASGTRDRRGVAGWVAWLTLLYGAILCDWLDGPLARHRGTSTVGTMLDWEADSWLTLCAAAGAVRWGDLPCSIVAAPLLRYPLMIDALRHKRYQELHQDEPHWVRPLGIVQMLVCIAALAPFRGRFTSRLLYLIVPLHPPLQIGGLLLLYWRKWRA